MTSPEPAPTAQIIWLKQDAPRKPAPGEPCNGCGVCCAAAPCPLSRLLLRHRDGACPALQWQDDSRQYRCGLLLAPVRHLPWLPRSATRLLQALIRRYIAAGSGCDSLVETETDITP